MALKKIIDRPHILEVDIAGENFVVGITNIKDALTVFNILADNGYNVTMSAVNNKEKNDEQDQGSIPDHQ